MIRRFFLTGNLLLFASVAGCSADYSYVPQPAVAQVGSTTQPQATPVTTLVSILGVRQADRKEGIPESFEARMRIENNGSEPVVFDPKTLEMENWQLLPFPPPFVRPPGPVTVPPMGAANFTAFFPFPALPPNADLDSLEIRWVIRIGSHDVNQSVTFRRVYQWADY
jgi:hypothetical protein